MPGDVVQAQYEQLDDLARRFEQQAEATGKISEQVRRGMAALQQGGWIGKGSAAFTREMSHEVLPALRRLESALAGGKQTTLGIAQIMRQAEEQAAQPFLQHGSAGSVSQPSLNGNGTTDNSSAQKDDAASVARRAWQLSRPDNLVNLVKETPIGAGDPRLNRAMEQLLNNPSPQKRDDLLRDIAQMRGRPFHEMKSDYEKYLRLRSEQRESVKEIDLVLNPNHLGSNESLRYGNIVGQVLGVDPVFGAMLNPTGGIMGPSNAGVRIATGDSYNYVAFRQPDDGAPLSNHTVSHDAFGYLLVNHGLGPGYNYLGIELGDPRSPLIGHVSGIMFWTGERVVNESLTHVDALFQNAKSVWGTVEKTAIGIGQSLL